jgi:DNA replication protein DnaC
MIIYQSNKEQFIKDLISNEIHEIIEATYKLKTGHRVAKNELRSWQESMRFMGAVMDDEEIPNDAGVSIEYSIPQTSKRIDFILTGQDQANNDQVVIIELKQWESAELTDKDAIVKTRFQHGLAETSHPSYQAWSYSELLNQLNETVYTDNIHLAPCAYLHNYIEDNVIKNNFYQPYIERAPVFLKGKDEKEKLKTFIKSFVKYGDKSNLMFRIENGKIKPSKSLADSLVKMIAGNPEFIMLDEQKLVYETAIKLAKESSPTNKNVLIVQGGPGTGKSVVAVNLLVNIIQQLRLVAQYITKNAAPRAVYEAKFVNLHLKLIHHLYLTLIHPSDQVIFH